MRLCSSVGGQLGRELTQILSPQLTPPVMRQFLVPELLRQNFLKTLPHCATLLKWGA